MNLGNKQVDLGVYFGSWQVSSCIRTPHCFYKNHLSEDDDLLPIMYIKTLLFGKEVIPYTLSDPRNVLSHFQMLLGKAYNEADLEKFKKYVSAELVQGADNGYEYYVELDGERISIPVFSAITMLFRELSKLLVLSEGITDPRKIVVTVPLSFRAAQKNSLKSAIKDAGFSDIQLVSDTKAALYSFQDFIEKEKYVFCICCDYNYTSATYFKRGESGAWIAEKNFNLKYRFLEYITSFAETVVNHLWADIENMLESRAGDRNAILPCVTSKLCQIISNQAKAYSRNSQTIDWKETIAFRYNGEKFSYSFRFNELEEVVKHFCEDLINDLKCAGSETTENAITSLRGIDKAAFICVGDCFLFPQAQIAFIEYMKSDTVRGLVAIQRYSSSLNAGKVNDIIRNEVIGHSPYSESNSNDDLRSQEPSHIAQSSQHVASLDLTNHHITWSSADVLSMGAIRSAFDPQVVQSLPFSLVRSDLNDIEIGGTTDYDIGFLLPNLTTHKKDKFFILIKKNTKYPFTSIRENKKQKYCFSRNKEMILSFYEDVQSSRDENINGYTPTGNMKSYKPFKQYKLFRDDDHPYIPYPVKPEGCNDEAAFRNSPEYRRYKEARNKCLFTIDCSMNEDGTLSARMTWVDTQKRIRADDLANDRQEIDRKNRALAFMSQRSINYLVLLINKQYKKITALTLRENGLPTIMRDE